MPGTAIVVFTGRNVETLLNDGGSSCWVLNPARARGCEFLVCTWNARSRLGQAQVAQHGAAFLVGKVSGVSPCQRPPLQGREHLTGHTVLFDEYALIAVPNVWSGQRNPVAYSADVERDLGMSLDLAQWKRA